MIQITLRQLEYFVAAAQQGGAARAAESLHVSQPSISKAIADLEAMWGEPLFVRHHAKGLSLTATGLSRSRQAHQLLDAARDLQQASGSAIAGHLRLGFLSTLGPLWIPTIVAQLRKRHPDLHLELVEGDAASLTRQLENRELDAALLYELGLARPGLQVHPVCALSPYLLLPARHYLASATSIRLADVATEKVILVGLPLSREYFLTLFRQAGVSPLVTHEFNSIDMVRAMVAAGHGVALLTTRPRVDRTHDGKRVVCKRIRGEMQKQQVLLASPRTAPTPLLQPLLEVAKEVLNAAQ